MTFCSDASRARGEALRATASSVQAFLLIEDPGPWGPQILRSKRLPEQLRPFSVIAVGYPAEGQNNRFVDRYEASRVHYETYGNPIVKL